MLRLKIQALNIFNHINIKSHLFCLSEINHQYPKNVKTLQNSLSWSAYLSTCDYEKTLGCGELKPLIT